MDTHLYVSERPKYERLDLLATASDVKLDPVTDQIEIVRYDDSSLEKLRQEQRQDMNTIL